MKIECLIAALALPQALLAGTIGSPSPADSATAPSLHSATMQAFDALSWAQKKAKLALDGEDAWRVAAKTDSRTNNVPVRLSWSGTSGACEVTVREDASKKVVLSTTVTGTAVDVYDLQVGRNYEWTVKNGTASATWGFTTPRTLPRIINKTFVSNLSTCRDLGGYVTAGGKVVKQGMLFRSGHVVYGAYVAKNERNALFDHYWNEVVGLKTEIDLRTPDYYKYENAEYGYTGSPFGPNVTFWNAQEQTGYEWGYYTDVFTKASAKNALKATFVQFCDAAKYPIDFHCSQGRDRTGTLAFFLLGVLGVSLDDVYLDYCFTDYCDNDDGGEGAIEDTYAKLAALYPDATYPTLQQKCVAYLKSLGVTDEQIAAYREIMLEDVEERPGEPVDPDAPDEPPALTTVLAITNVTKKVTAVPGTFAPGADENALLEVVGTNGRFAFQAEGVRNIIGCNDASATPTGTVTVRLVAGATGWTTPTTAPLQSAGEDSKLLFGNNVVFDIDATAVGVPAERMTNTLYLAYGTDGVRFGSSGSGVAQAFFDRSTVRVADGATGWLEFPSDRQTIRLHVVKTVEPAPEDDPEPTEPATGVPVLTSPTNFATVATLPAALKAFNALSTSEQSALLKDASAADTPYRKELAVAASGSALPVLLSWEGVGEGLCTVTVRRDRDDVVVFETNTAKRTVGFHNPEIGRNYRWTVQTPDGSATGWFYTEAEGPRMISPAVGRIENARDLGGWPTEDGLVVRQGLIFRSKAPEDYAVGRQIPYWRDVLGIRLDLDLRSAAEARDAGSGADSSPIGTGVAYFNSDVALGVTFGGDYDSCLYEDEEGAASRQAIAADFRQLMAAGHLPAVFHCAAGRDRTGCFAWFLNALLGVSEKDLATDFFYPWVTFSSWSCSSAYEWLPTLVDNLRKKYPDADYPTLKSKAEAFFKWCGLTDAEIAAFRETMTEPREEKRTTAGEEPVGPPVEPSARIEGEVVAQPGAGYAGSTVTVCVAELVTGEYSGDAFRATLAVNGKTYAGEVTPGGTDGGCRVTFAVDATGEHAVVAKNAYVGVMELWLEDESHGRTDLLVRDVTLVQGNVVRETHPWFREVAPDFGTDGEWEQVDEMLRVYTPSNAMPEGAEATVETEFVFAGPSDADDDSFTRTPQCAARVVSEDGGGNVLQVYSALPDAKGGMSLGWHDANMPESAGYEFVAGVGYVIRFEFDYPTGALGGAVRLVCSAKSANEAAFVKLFEGFAATTCVGGVIDANRASRVGFFGTDAGSVDSLLGEYAVTHIEAEVAGPTVDGKAVEPAVVFETARTTKPIEYPSAPELTGEVGAQTIAFGGVSVPVPRHYTATLSGSTVTVALNDFARPVLEDSDDDKKAIAVGETTVTLHVGRRIDGLFYRVVTTTALGGDWKPVTEFLPVVDFTVDRVKTDSAAFYKIEVSDVREGK